MRRITCATDFNRWANSIKMQQEMGGPVMKLDNSWVFKHPDGMVSYGNVVLEDDGCCMPFIRGNSTMWAPEGPQNYWSYDMHFLFPANRRGARAVAAARKMVAEMFTSYAADRITGTIPRWNLAARMVIRHLGFAPVGTTELGGKPAVMYALDKATWRGQQPQQAST